MCIVLVGLRAAGWLENTTNSALQELRWRW